MSFHWIAWTVCVQSIHLLSAVDAASYEHLGCFNDQEPPARDLMGEEVALDTLSLAQCAQSCQTAGFPYAGMQGGNACFCGHTYGKHGLAPDPDEACNYTCGVDSCGGHLATDVYYSLDKSSAKESQRMLVHHNSPLNFNLARSSCVSSDGDLAITMDTASLNATMQVALDNGLANTENVFIGIKRGLLVADTEYQWTDSTAPAFTLTDPTYSAFWAQQETHINHCVQLMLDGGRWSTTSCAFSLTYVCKQLPPVVTPAPTSTKSSGSDEGGFDRTQLSLYIVLPMFLLCYGGSCVLYCASKLHKSIKRNKRQKMNLAKIDTLSEYEPETKPAKAMVTPSGNPRGRSPRPLSAGKTAKVYPLGEVPARQGARPMYHPPPRGAGPPPPPVARPYPPPPMHSRMPPSTSAARSAVASTETSSSAEGDGSRPATSRAVEISMQDSLASSAASSRVSSQDGVCMATAPAPRASAHRTKDDIKKAKLLENALKEARERRRQERIARGEDPESRPGTAVDMHTPVPATQGGDYVKKTKKTKHGEDGPDGRRSKREKSKDRTKSAVYGESQDSGDSTTNLLSDSDKPESPSSEATLPPRDPTKMSIQDILKMKMAMKTQHRKPKKIMAA